MNCVVLQPSYIPWRGYFHQIWKADVFVFYDDVQYDDRGWRNRNRIKTPAGVRWLTIPVHSKGCQVEHTPISEIEICRHTRWQSKHWRSLQHSYHRAPFFDRFAPLLQEFYQRDWERLGDFTCELTVALARALGIRKTHFLRSSALNPQGRKTDRLLEILFKVGATHYITGPSAKTYLDEKKFQAAGISIEYMRYNYPEYPQLYPPYDGEVSILDLLFMTGPNALDFIINETPVSHDFPTDEPALVSTSMSEIGVSVSDAVATPRQTSSHPSTGGFL